MSKTSNLRNEHRNVAICNMNNGDCTEIWKQLDASKLEATKHCQIYKDSKKGSLACFNVTDMPLLKKSYLIRACEIVIFHFENSEFDVAYFKILLKFIPTAIITFSNNADVNSIKKTVDSIFPNTRYVKLSLLVDTLFRMKYEYSNVSKTRSGFVALDSQINESGELVIRTILNKKINSRFVACNGITLMEIRSVLALPDNVYYDMTSEFDPQVFRVREKSMGDMGSAEASSFTNNSYKFTTFEQLKLDLSLVRSPNLHFFNKRYECAIRKMLVSFDSPICAEITFKRTECNLIDQERMLMFYVLYPAENTGSMLNTDFDFDRPIHSYQEYIMDNGFVSINSKTFVSDKGAKDIKIVKESGNSGTLTFIYPYFLGIGKICLYQPMEVGEISVDCFRGVLYNPVYREQTLCDITSLKGIPHKIMKKSCVIHRMFSNEKEVKEYGATMLVSGKIKGVILKSVGLHGRFKAKFDSPLKYGDVVKINLYRRINID